MMSSNDNIIFEGHVFRDSASRLIIPEDIYHALQNTKCTNSYEFSMQMSQNDAKAVSDYNYYASWFILVKNDGGLKKCINAAKVKGAKDSDSINKMIENGEIVLFQVQINSAEEVFESKLKVSKQPSSEETLQEYNSFTEKETKAIENELKDIVSNIAIKSEGDYNELKYKLSELEDRSYYLYSKALGLSYGNESITKDAESRYNIFKAKIDAVRGKLELNHDEFIGVGVKKGKDYYNFSSEKYPSLIDNTLKDIISDINQYSDANYSKIKTDFKNLYNDIYAIYQLSLNSASEMDCMTKVLLDESIKKYKSVIEIIGKEEARLEGLHSQNMPFFGSLIKKPNEK